MLFQSLHSHSFVHSKFYKEILVLLYRYNNIRLLWNGVWPRLSDIKAKLKHKTIKWIWVRLKENQSRPDKEEWMPVRNSCACLFFLSKTLDWIQCSVPSFLWTIQVLGGLVPVNRMSNGPSSYNGVWWAWISKDTGQGTGGSRGVMSGESSAVCPDSRCGYAWLFSMSIDQTLSGKCDKEVISERTCRYQESHPY